MQYFCFKFFFFLNRFLIFGSRFSKFTIHNSLHAHAFRLQCDEREFVRDWWIRERLNLAYTQVNVGDFKFRESFSLIFDISNTLIGLQPRNRYKNGQAYTDNSLRKMEVIVVSDTRHIFNLKCWCDIGYRFRSFYSLDLEFGSVLSIFIDTSFSFPHSNATTIAFLEYHWLINYT